MRFDVDGAICKTTKNNYRSSKPDQKNLLRTINILYNKNLLISKFSLADSWVGAREKVFGNEKRAKTGQKSIKKFRKSNIMNLS